MELLSKITYWAFPITPETLWIELFWRVTPLLIIFLVLIEIKKENSAKDQLMFCIPIFSTIILTTLYFKLFEGLLASRLDCEIFFFLGISLSIFCGLNSIMTTILPVYWLLDKNPKLKIFVVLTIIASLIISTFSGVLSIYRNNTEILFDYCIFIVIGTVVILTFTCFPRNKNI